MFPEVSVEIYMTGNSPKSDPQFRRNEIYTTWYGRCCDVGIKCKLCDWISSLHNHTSYITNIHYIY